MTICPNCGSEVEDDSVFCEECGFKISDRQQVKNTNQPKADDKKKIRFVKRK